MSSRNAEPAGRRTRPLVIYANRRGGWSAWGLWSVRTLLAWLRWVITGSGFAWYMLCAFLIGMGAAGAEPLGYVGCALAGGVPVATGLAGIVKGRGQLEMPNVFRAVVAMVPVCVTGAAVAVTAWENSKTVSNGFWAVVVAFVIYFGYKGAQDKKAEQALAAEPKVGQVWYVDVPNDNAAEVTSFKTRPAVVVEAAGADKRWTVLWSTTQEHRSGQRGYLDVSDLAGWPQARGKDHSHLAVRSPFRPARRDFKDFHSVLPPASFDTIMHARRATR